MKKPIILTVLTSIIMGILFSIDAGCAEAEVTSMSLQDEPEVIEVEIEDEYNIYEECMIRSNEILTMEDKEEKLMQYMDLICEYRDLLEPPILLQDMFSEEEIYLICRCVETEVYQCSFSEKVNVSAVIFNRLASETFPNSIDAVIIPGQFAFWRTDISEDTYRAVQYAWLFGGDCEDALFFNSCATPVDFYGEYFYTDEAGHHFYH